MKLRPLLNPDHPPSGDMLSLLEWFETRCRVRGAAWVSEDDVRRFLREEGRPDLAEAFVSDYFCALPADAQ